MAEFPKGCQQVELTEQQMIESLQSLPSAQEEQESFFFTHFPVSKNHHSFHNVEMGT